MKNKINHKIFLTPHFAIFITGWLDLCLTIEVILMGGSEINPFYAYLIAKHIILFFIVRCLVIIFFHELSLKYYEKYKLFFITIIVIWTIACINNFIVLINLDLF